MKKVDTIERTQIERPTRPARAKRVKRIHSAEFKARVVAACCAPGASVAGVALANGVNANLVRKWIIKHRRASPPTGPIGLLPVRVLADVPRVEPPRVAEQPAASQCIEIELGEAVIRVPADFDSGTLRSIVRILRDTLVR